MKSARMIRILFLATILAPSASVHGDTFFDFGLQWTQWVPNRGKIQKFEKESTPTILSVPSPTSIESVSRAADASNSNNAGSTTTQSVSGTSSRPVESPAVQNSGAIQSYYSTFGSNSAQSAPSNYVPLGNVPPPPPVQVTNVAPSTPVVNAPAVTTVNTYPITAPPATNYATPTVTSSSNRFDALIRMDAGPYPLSDRLLQGQADAWYTSPVVKSLYGGTPSNDQQRAFENDVLQKVRKTYADSGVQLNLTTDASANAARTVSVISGASYGADSKVAGITVMNGDGFSFIDKLDRAANIDELEWAVARNVAHELLHSFNVGHLDSTGTYLDAAVANWDMLLSPDTKFSELAVTDLRNKIAGGIPESTSSAIGFFGQHITESATCAHCIAAQMIEVQPVPEPATIAIWAVGALIAYRAHGKRKLRKV